MSVRTTVLTNTHSLWHTHTHSIGLCVHSLVGRLEKSLHLISPPDRVEPRDTENHVNAKRAQEFTSETEGETGAWGVGLSPGEWGFCRLGTPVVARVVGHSSPDSYGTVKRFTSSVLESCGVINGFLHERNGELILHSSHHSVITVRYLGRQTAQMEWKK